MRMSSLSSFPRLFYSGATQLCRWGRVERVRMFARPFWFFFPSLKDVPLFFSSVIKSPYVNYLLSCKFTYISQLIAQTFLNIPILGL